MATTDGITRSSLLIQKMTANAPVVNLYKQWNIVCTKISMPKYETKDIPVVDFKGSDGDDAYIPSYIPIKPYECTYEFAYKGSLDSCYTNIYLGFIKYLLGTKPANEDYSNITEGGFNIYDKYNNIGRQKVSVNVFDPNDLVHDEGDHLTFKVTFKFHDPTTDITLTDPNDKVTL